MDTIIINTDPAVMERTRLKMKSALTHMRILIIKDGLDIVEAADVASEAHKVNKVKLLKVYDDLQAENLYRE